MNTTHWSGEEISLRSLEQSLQGIDESAVAILLAEYS